jgi:hypothetical protein
VARAGSTGAFAFHGQGSAPAQRSGVASNAIAIEAIKERCIGASMRSGEV